MVIPLKKVLLSILQKLDSHLDAEGQEISEILSIRANQTRYIIVSPLSILSVDINFRLTLATDRSVSLAISA